MTQPNQDELDARLIEAAASAGRLNVFVPDDPYVEEADANPERRNNGCLIYQVGDRD